MCRDVPFKIIITDSALGLTCVPLPGTAQSCRDMPTIGIAWCLGIESQASRTYPRIPLVRQFPGTLTALALVAQMDFFDGSTRRNAFVLCQCWQLSTAQRFGDECRRQQSVIGETVVPRLGRVVAIFPIPTIMTFRSESHWRWPTALFHDEKLSYAISVFRRVRQIQTQWNQQWWWRNGQSQVRRGKKSEVD